MIEKQVNLLTGDAALNYFYRLIEKRGERVCGVVKFNHDRHTLVKVFPELDKKGECFQKRYYIVYKKEKGFYTFCKQFEKFINANPEYDGTDGESINEESLNQLPVYNEPNDEETAKGIRYVDLKLVFIYPDGSTRWVLPAFFKKFAEKNGLIRLQNRMNYYKSSNYDGYDTPEQEKTYSIPVSLLKEEI